MKNKILKNTLYMILFFSLFIFIGKLLRYALNDDTESYTRLTYHEMYEQDNIDILFLGTSHCMHSLDPALLDKEFNMNTFNAASSSQLPDGSLMLLKEADKYNDIKHVYLDIFYNSAYDVHKERTQMTATYIISDYLKLSLDKIFYLLKASGSEHYANSFIVARRCWKKMFEPSFVISLLKKKSSDAYRKYSYEPVKHENSEYAGKGYIKNLSKVDNWNFFDTWGWLPASPETFSDDYRNDLLAIIDYCQQHNIELTLICAPTSDFCLTAIGDYDDCIAWIKKLTDEKGIEYYDFNLCREQYFPASSEYFIDPVHLNHDGALKLASTFGMLVRGEVSYDEMFYPSYEEKKNSIEPTVFGISYMSEYDDDGNVKKNCRIVSNMPEDLECRILVNPEGKQEYLLRDYSQELFFMIDQDLTGTITIEYKNIGADDRTSKRRLLTIPDNGSS